MQSRIGEVIDSVISVAPRSADEARLVPPASGPVRARCARARGRRRELCPRRANGDELDLDPVQHRPGVLVCWGVGRDRDPARPRLLGEGRVLFDGLEPEHIELELVRTLEAPNVLHLRYEVRRPETSTCKAGSARSSIQSSASHLVAQMKHVWCLQRPDQFELDVLGLEAVEENSALAEQTGTSWISIPSNTAQECLCAGVLDGIEIQLVPVCSARAEFSSTASSPSTSSSNWSGRWRHQTCFICATRCDADD